MKHYFLLIIGLFIFTGVYTQRSVKVCGEIDYVVLETQTQVEAIREELEKKGNDLHKKWIICLVCNAHIKV